MPHRNPLRNRLSCDGPLREPYTCYLQGGLNFAASRAGVLLAVQNAYFKD